MRTKQSASILPQKFFAIRGPGTAAVTGSRRESGWEETNQQHVKDRDPAATVSFYMCADRRKWSGAGETVKRVTDETPTD